MTKKSLFTVFKDYPEIFIAISDKKEGPMKVRYELENDEKTLRNRERFMRKFGIESKQVTSAKLAHLNNLKVVDSAYGGQFLERTDSLITQEKNLYLSITVADCIPLFIYDPVKKTIALVHAGWKGLLKKIITKTVKTLRDNFNSDPKDLIVGIGPGIGPCHFEIKKDLVYKFKNYDFSIQSRDGKIFVDLKKIAEKQLKDSGIVKIEINSDCTFCKSNKYMSARRDKTDPLEAMLVLLGRRG